MSNGAMDDDAEQFSLRWNNFHNNLTCGFHELLEEKDLVDVTLACDGQYVQAHKLVLTVCSPYFKALFKVNPNTHPIVILKDVNFSDLQAILQFMYRGEVNVKQDELTNFLKTAEVLKIKGLTGDDKGPGSSRQQIQETTSKTAPSERQPPSPSSAPPPKRKRTQEPPVPTPVRTPSPIATGSAPQVRASPLPPQVAPPDSDLEYIDVAETKVEPADFVDDDQYSRDELNDDDLSMSASDPLSSSSQMLVPPPLMAGPSTSRDSTGKEALQGIASFAGIAGPSHDTSGPSSELTSQEAALLKCGGVYHCPICPMKEFSTKSNLLKHYRNIHGSSKGPLIITENGEYLYENDEYLYENDEGLAENDEDLSENDEDLSENDEDLAGNDEGLAEKVNQLEKSMSLRNQELEALRRETTAAINREPDEMPEAEPPAVPLVSIIKKRSSTTAETERHGKRVSFSRSKTMILYSPRMLN